MIAPPTMRIGIDVGGTFADVFVVDGATGRTVRDKLRSTPQIERHQSRDGIGVGVEWCLLDAAQDLDPTQRLDEHDGHDGKFAQNPLRPSCPLCRRAPT